MIRFCDDSRLGYAASRRIFLPGEGLRFDESYRLAHLPLVTPGHPLAIASLPGRDYVDGRYAADRHALVAPVAADALAASPVFRAVDDALRAASFAGKVAWDLCERRAGQLHATLASGLALAELPRIADAVERVLADLGPLWFRLGGPFVGNKNLGRIYFPAYPQLVAGEDAFGLLQAAAGLPRTRFYVVGYYHMAEELGPAEATELAAILDRFGPATLGVFPVRRLVIHATNDDLVLSGREVLGIPGIRQDGPAP